MAASSTSSIPKSFKYDVFVSFTGEDIRNTFIDHLYDALQQHGIHTYKDKERLKRGKRIDDGRLKCIEDSKIFIIVFSENYAFSSWCLDELVKIMECRKTTNRVAYSVFYHIDRSEVLKQHGVLTKHNKEESAAKRKDALREVGHLVWWDLKFGDEGELIKRIVKKISRNLNLDATKLSVPEELIGMETRIKEVESSLEVGLDDVHMIGIKGIGGGGKTALAKALFNKVSFQFEGISFVENVREVSKASGLLSLKKQVLTDILDVKDIDIYSERKAQMWSRCLSMKILLVLDDVDQYDQLDAFVPWATRLGPGSRIVITTRDENLLVAHGVKWIYDVNLLSDKEAFCLFSRCAFSKDIPDQGYEKLSQQAIHYAAGLPLAIKSLGSFLCDKDKTEWMDTLERLKTGPIMEVQENLELSYVSLDDVTKEVFLDIACLLNGVPKHDAIRILESCGFNAINDIKILERKSLVTINDNGVLGMHVQIEAMGRYIVRCWHPNEPNRHSHLWICKEIEHILAKGLGTDATEAISVDSPVKLSSEIVTKGFGSMERLRLLRMVSEIDEEFEFDVKIDKVSLTFPDALQFLSWVGYPHWSLPKTFQANNLVALEMPYSRISQLWEGEERKVLKKLKYLDLSHSKLTTLDLGLTPNLETLNLEKCHDLVELRMLVGCPKLRSADLSHSKLRILDLKLTPNLERLDLQDCYHLVELRAPNGCLKRLVFLNLNGCSKIINSFLFIKQLESLEVLSLTRLYLKEFPDVIPGHLDNSLHEFRFRYNDVEELPSSIGNLQNLVYLDLHSCRKLTSLPGSICGLRRIRNLKLYGCSSLEELPEGIGQLECLEKLNLSFTRIKNLPDSICMLKHLKTLNLSSCWTLEKLPEHLGGLECLQNLILAECTQVREIPDSICTLKCLKYFSLLDCILLQKLPEELGLLECLEVLNIKGTRIRHLPRSIALLKDLQICGPKSGRRLHGFEST